MTTDLHVIIYSHVNLLLLFEWFFTVAIHYAREEGFYKNFYYKARKARKARKACKTRKARNLRKERNESSDCLGTSKSR